MGVRKVKAKCLEGEKGEGSVERYGYVPRRDSMLGPLS